MKLLRRDADFAALAKLTAVGETGRGVDIHSRAVNAKSKTFARRLVLADDTIAVLGRMLADMLDSLVHAVYDLYRQNIILLR